MKHEHSRRQFLQATGIAAVAAAAGQSGAFGQATPARTTAARVMPPLKPDFELGMASYTLRSFSLDDAIAMTKRVGLKNIALKSMHLPMDSTPEQIKAVAAKIKAAGLNLYGCGVVYMKNEEQVNQAFDYAKAAGMTTIIGAPSHELLPLVDKKVKAYDIKVAIHNHGPGDNVYPTPESIYEKVKDFDKRIGLCMDIGHTVRIGEDPAKDAVRFADRLHDVHAKDVSAAEAKGSTIEIGRGVIDIPMFMRTLLQIRYSGMVAFEYEKDAKDPLPGLSESIGYVNGVMATLSSRGYVRPTATRTAPTTAASRPR